MHNYSIRRQAPFVMDLIPQRVNGGKGALPILRRLQISSRFVLVSYLIDSQVFCSTVPESSTVFLLPFPVQLPFLSLCVLAMVKARLCSCFDICLLARRTSTENKRFLPRGLSGAD